MTITSEARDHVSWAPADRDLWVASDADGFLGTVDRTDDGWIASDSRGRALGTVGDLVDAKRLVVDAPHGDAAETRLQRIPSILTASAAAVGGTLALLIGVVR